jgi:hypothetical protein
VAHMYFKDGKYEHQKVSGVYRKIDSTIVFSDDSLISYDYKTGWIYCQGIYTLKLQVNDSALKLTGVWKDKKKGLFRCPTVATWFEKPLSTAVRISSGSSTSKAGEIKSENKEGMRTISPSALERLADIQKVIEIDSTEKDSIKIDVYDNGIVDDDTVSIYLNNIEIVGKQKISEKPITFYSNLDDKSPYQKIKLVAENLGKIPPNTAVVIITTKRKRYEVHLASDFKRNAVIEFFIK